MRLGLSSMASDEVIHYRHARWLCDCPYPEPIDLDNCPECGLEYCTVCGGERD